MQCIVCENILPNGHKLNYNDALYNKEYKLYHCNFCHTEFFYPNEMKQLEEIIMKMKINY